MLGKTIAITLSIFSLSALGLVWGATRLSAAHGWGHGADLAAVAGALVVGLLSAWLLARVVAIAVLGLLADDVVDAVEREHYPEARARMQRPSLALTARMAAASALRTLVWNALALPVYFVLLATGVGTIAVFAIVNAVLLGRDLGEMVAMRHMPLAEVGAWLGETRGARFVLGLVVTGLLSIPGVNLIAPILGAAMATHRFHASRPA